MKPFAVMLTMLMCCCSAQQQTADARVRSALDILAVVVDPAYQAAMQACTTRELLIADQAETGKLTVVEADKQLTTVRQRCSKQQRAFEAIRQGHGLAATQVEQGAVEDAEETIARVRQSFRDVSEGAEL